MKVSRTWLQKYFDTELPSVEELSNKLTFHAFEIEEMEGDMLDVKVLPDRATYALSHLGIAREVGAILGLRLKDDPLRASLPETPVQHSHLQVTIQDTARCTRYAGTLIKGVKVGPSPAWLKEALESVGSRSINNVVDATNYAMLDLGQPLHAFDASKLKNNEGGEYSIVVRNAREGEKITTLTGEEYTLPASTLLITDGNADAPIGVAGVKGGKQAQVDETTTDIIIESAHFEGTGIRKTSQTLKLWTDASLRYQNKLSAELVPHAMRDVVALIQKIAGGEVVASTDVYEVPETKAPALEVTLQKINAVLGTQYGVEEVVEALTRLDFGYMASQGKFTVIVPYYRRDLVIPEDLVEEIGRILGYDKIQSIPLPPLEGIIDQNKFRGIERIKDFLTEQGFTEISTQTFAPAGDIILANPLQSDMPALRTNLSENMNDALRRGLTSAPRVLGVAESLKLFEIGTVFKKEGEFLSLCLGYGWLSGKKSANFIEQIHTELQESFPNVFEKAISKSAEDLEMIMIADELVKLGEQSAPKKVTLGTFRPFSIYPFALRDIAVWTPSGTEESEVLLVIEREAGDLLARVDLFDRFEKEGRISYAFRLVLESFERTLSDADIDPIMAKISSNLNALEGFEVR